MPRDYFSNLERKRAKLRSQIQELAAELRQVELEIVEAKAGESLYDGKIKVNKKNKNKAFLYGLIRNFLFEYYEKYHGRGLTTKELYDMISPMHKNLKYTSFRSSLHRFQQDNLIAKTGHGGAWRLVETMEKEK